MIELSMENFSLQVNRIQIARKACITMKGLCCLCISSDAGIIKNIRLLFTKTHLYSSNEVKVEGNVKIRNLSLEASKFHFLLNPNVIFNGKDRVLEALCLLNSGEASSIAKKLGISFLKKRICKLNTCESRLFEIAVNLAVRPEVIYLKDIKMPHRLHKRCIGALREYVNNDYGVVIVETDFTEQFDSAVIIRNGLILSLDHREAIDFFKHRRNNVFNFTNAVKNHPHLAYLLRDSIECDSFDYKNQFKQYATECIVDIKQKKISLITRIFTLGIYQVQGLQALRLGLRRYEMNIQKYDKRIGICKTIFPCIICILVARLQPILNDSSLLVYLPDAFCLLIGAYYRSDKLIFLIIFVCKDFLLREVSITRVKYLIHHLLRSEITDSGYKLIFASVCFSIVFNYSSILEEEYQILNYTMNVLITPGTYVISLFLYIFLTHFTTFVTIGLIFSIKPMPFFVVSSTFTNLLFCSFTGKRLRASMIGALIAIFIVITFAGMNNIDLLVIKYFYPLVLPGFTFADSLELKLFHFSLIVNPSTIYFCAYCAFTYLFCCLNLSYR